MKLGIVNPKTRIIQFQDIEANKDERWSIFKFIQRNILVDIEEVIKVPYKGDFFDQHIRPNLLMKYNEGYRRMCIC